MDLAARSLALDRAFRMQLQIASVQALADRAISKRTKCNRTLIVQMDLTQLPKEGPPIRLITCARVFARLMSRVPKYS